LWFNSFAAKEKLEVVNVCGFAAIFCTAVQSEPRLRSNRGRGNSVRAIFRIHCIHRIMIIKIAEYTIKPMALNEVLKAIERFVNEIHANEPNIVYEAYRKGESFDFIHLMKFPDKEAEKNHARADYTKAFVKILYPNCQKEPIFTDLNSVS
jgi:quinol monooxygenase YgiN